MIAIDFTGSNGTPTHPTSLHYMNPNQQILNQYQQTLIPISEILIQYDYDKQISCFGFGAKTCFNNIKDKQVSHCFPLSGDINCD